MAGSTCWKKTASLRCHNPENVKVFRVLLAAITSRRYPTSALSANHAGCAAPLSHTQHKMKAESCGLGELDPEKHLIAMLGQSLKTLSANA
jgi:hypothetical protein